MSKIVELTKELEQRKIDANAKAPPVIVQPRGIGSGDVNLWFVESESAGLVIRKKDGSRVCGTSIMGLMMLGAAYGDEIVLHASGDGADEALDRLAGLVGDRFGED